MTVLRNSLIGNPAFWAVIMFFVEGFLQVSGIQDSMLAGTLGAIAILLLVYAIVEWVQLPLGAMFTLPGLRSLSFGWMVALPEANRIVYDALKGSAIRKFIDNNFDTVDKKLCVTANYVAGTDAPLFAREPAGAALISFDKNVLNTGVFHAGGSEFKQHGKHDALYLDVSVRRGELKRAIKELKALSKQMPNQQGFI